MAKAHCETLCESIALRRDGRCSLQEQLCEFFRASILKGRIRRGRRVPASRRLASALGISRTTVVEAYERLQAQGYLVARPRAGLFVANVFPEEFSLSRIGGMAVDHSAASPPRAAHAGLCAQLAAPICSDALTPGIPAIDQFPWAAWNRLSARLLHARQSSIIGHGDPRGELALREAVAEYLGATRGIACTAEQIIIGCGSQALMETIVRCIAGPGDQVWFEEPGDPASREVLRALRLQPIAVRVDHDGLDVAEGCRRAPLARFALVAPSHHYPLAVTMSLDRRRALLDWAAGRRAWIVENEIDADYRFVRRAREPLFTLDEAQRVIHLGSFNKALAPGLRIGYAVLPLELLESLPVVSPMVNAQHQLLLARMWTEGQLASHMRCLREVHARRRTLLIEALQKEAGNLLGLTVLPEAGLRVAVRLWGRRKDVEVAALCAARGLKVGRALSVCYAESIPMSGLTLGFASAADAQIEPAVRKLADVIRSCPGS